ncbi:hypothetical protein EDEG_00401 [Edhazardia aedis USNM 41457]|uniref:Uncharacterized protein n=1 Tax=Edhazardia aedis (strain USNM 41457) TaxID=1003232 RepID=J9D183_EDHAE|nr:hypothetical protein EDEG_00401 [Edhazardia aedis USNM 41457]|eukprot:EJW01586.1 hypothetical protein EDEG_00401 [Edhazardia aedis USNM 41457]
MVLDDEMKKIIILNIIVFSAIFGISILVLICRWCLKKFYMKKVDKNLINAFNKIIETGEEKNFDVVEYMKNNILLQEELWNDKRRLDKTSCVKASIKTYLHVDMLYKLKIQLLSISLNNLKLEYRSRQNVEIPGINDAMFDILKKCILVRFV